MPNGKLQGLERTGLSEIGLELETTSVGCSGRQSLKLYAVLQKDLGAGPVRVEYSVFQYAVPLQHCVSYDIGARTGRHLEHCTYAGSLCQVGHTCLGFCLPRLTVSASFLNIERKGLRSDTALQIHFTQPAGITGHIMLMLMFVIYTTSLPHFQKHNWALFQFSHYLFLPLNQIKRRNI